MAINQEQYRKDFPFFRNNPDLVYLDSAATTQKPDMVLEALSTYNHSNHANIHRGAYKLSIAATEMYDSVREKVGQFIHADSSEEIIFTKGTTESINMIANCFGETQLEEGDEIVLSILEHHSNLVPWQQLAIRKKLKLTYMYTNKDGIIETEEIEEKIKSGVKLVAITMISNAIGVKTPIEAIIKRTHEVGGVVVVDGAQAVPHEPIDVVDMNIDFLAFSGHKMMASTGIGILYGKKALLEKMSPYHYGGDMIEYVEEQSSTFAPLPNRLEAGTPNIEGVISLGAAIDYINHIGYETIHAHEMALTSYALAELQKLEYVTIIGTTDIDMKGPVISFNIKDVHSHDTAFILDNANIAVRSGHHCAQPLMKYMQIPSTARVSFYLYNTKEDINKLINNIKQVRRWLGYGS